MGKGSAPSPVDLTYSGLLPCSNARNAMVNIQSAILCKWVYSDAEYTHPPLGKLMFRQTPNPEEGRHLHWVLIADWSNRTAFLVFRGSCTAFDWVQENPALSFTRRRVAGECLKIHTGFWTAIDNDADLLSQQIRGLLSQGMQSLVLCGHSKGGANATVLAMRLLLPGLEPDGQAIHMKGCGVSLITFGAPNVIARSDAFYRFQSLLQTSDAFPIWTINCRLSSESVRMSNIGSKETPALWTFDGTDTDKSMQISNIGGKDTLALMRHLGGDGMNVITRAVAICPRLVLDNGDLQLPGIGDIVALYQITEWSQGKRGFTARVEFKRFVQISGFPQLHPFPIVECPSESPVHFSNLWVHAKDPVPVALSTRAGDVRQFLKSDVIPKGVQWAAEYWIPEQVKKIHNAFDELQHVAEQYAPVIRPSILSDNGSTVFDIAYHPMDAYLNQLASQMMNHELHEVAFCCAGSLFDSYPDVLNKLTCRYERDFLNASNPEICTEAMRIFCHKAVPLYKRPPMIKVLVQKLTDRQPLVRKGAVEALGRLQAYGALDDLLEVLDDEDRGVKLALNNVLKSMLAFRSRL